MKIDNNMKRSEKRKREYNQKRRKIKNMVLFSIIIIVLISVSVLLMNFLGGNENIDYDSKSQDSSIYSSTEISIPLGDLSDDVKFYTFDSKGITIKYFAVVGSDGDVHVALNACDVCYGAKKGYRQVDDVMHCINCGREFLINSIGTENTVGGCWPSYIPFRVLDDNVLIEISDLNSKGYMF